MSDRAEQGNVDPWAKELDDLTRALSGAYLFGIPLLYTMEMWWIGTYVDLWKLIAFLVLALAVNVHFAFVAGFRASRGVSVADGAFQAIETVAVGLIAATVVLFILNRVSPGEPLDSVLGKIIIQAVPLSIGAAIASSILGTRDGKSRQGDEEQSKPSAARATLMDVGATASGAIFISFPTAPTEEIAMLAAQLDLWHEAALVVFTLAITYAIVFESQFSPQRVGADRPGPFQHPLVETVLAYVVALLVALIALFLFGHIEAHEPLGSMASEVFVLGLPAAIGGAAGRLVS